MRRTFRFGKSELRIVAETETTRSEGDEQPIENEGDAPIDVVARNPFRPRNLLLVPSAVFILVGLFGGSGSALWWWLLLPGFAGIAAWEGLRRWENRL